MKKKHYLLLFFYTFALTNLHAQKKKVKSDPFPDEQTIALLEKLSPADATDTSKEKLTINIDTTTKIGVRKDLDYAIHISNYNLARKFVNTTAFAGNDEATKVVALTTSQRKVLDWIEAMRVQASFLYHYLFNEPLSPAQGRIAYSWGSKQYDVRKKPPGTGDCCTYQIHGLDCSGFIYQLLLHNNIVIPKSDAYADQERQPTFLKKYLKAYFKNVPFDVIDLKKIKVNDMQAGDIIYFTYANGVAYHIGMILTNDEGTKSLYQCLGSPNRRKDDNTICRNNMNAHHGVLVSKLDSTIETRRYGCVRVVAR